MQEFSSVRRAIQRLTQRLRSCIAEVVPAQLEPGEVPQVWGLSQGFRSRIADAVVVQFEMCHIQVDDRVPAVVPVGECRSPQRWPAPEPGPGVSALPEGMTMHQNGRIDRLQVRCS